jgi:hypothetical protein
MTAKSLLIVGTLGLTSLAFAGTKSYDIILNAPAMAGTNQLQAGEYKLKVEGSLGGETHAVFTQNSKTWSVPVKVENGTQKFAQTTVESSTQGEMDTIQAIDLAGSTTKLELQ